MNYPQLAAIGRVVQHLLDHFHAAKLVADEATGKLVMVSPEHRRRGNPYGHV